MFSSWPSVKDYPEWLRGHGAESFKFLEPGVRQPGWMPSKFLSRSVHLGELTSLGAISPRESSEYENNGPGYVHKRPYLFLRP